MIIITTVIIIIVIIIINNIINLGDHCHQYYHNYHQHDIMSIIIITIIIFLCTVNGKGEWSLHDLEVGEVQNLHKISNVGGCQLREKLARGGNWAMFRFKAVGTIARFSGRGPCGSIIIIIIMISYAKPSEILYVLCFPLKSPNSPFCLLMFTHGPS